MTTPTEPGFPAPPLPPGYAPPPPPGQPGMYPPAGYKLSRPRTSIWRVLGVVVFVGVIGFNLLIMLAMVGGLGVLAGGGSEQRGVVEYSRESGEGGKIAVIEVDGVIMEGGGGLFGGGVDPVALVSDGLRRAEKDDTVDAVIIEVNSPGGGVTASDLIHHEIVRFREKSSKPVVVYMKDLAASGGYYISAPADYIVANPTTLTGSIGVIIQGFNFHGTLTEVVKGEEATIKAGDNKTMGSMFADPESAEYKEGRALLQELVDEMHIHFKKVVKDGRSQTRQGGKALSADWETYADGRILSASQALKIGLIDEIGYFEQAKAKAEALAGIQNAAVVDYGREVGLGALFGVTSKDTQPDLEKAISENLRAEVQEQLRLYPGRPMAIWVP